MTSADEYALLRERIVKGQVLTPDSEGYEESLKRWSDTCIQPAAVVVKPANAMEVSEAVIFATSRRLPLAVKGGGHSTSGTSSSDGGLVIDLGLIKDVKVDPDDKTVKVGGGALWSDVDDKCWAHKLGVVGGTINDTGVGGLALGGGFGYLMPRHGLTLDNLLEAEVVLADGRILTASHAENPDLFWALRGAGQNFGVVTRFVFQAHDVGDVYAGTIALRAEDLGVMVDFTNFMHEAQDPDSTLIWGFACLPPHNEPAVLGAMFYHGTEAQGVEFFAPLLRVAVADDARARPYPEANTLLNSTFRRPPRALQGGATFVPPLRREQVEETLALFTPLVRSNGLHRSLLMYEIIPNAKVRSVGVEETAFAARNDIYHVSTLWLWSDPGIDATVREFNQDIIRHVKETGGNTQWVSQYNNYAGETIEPEKRFGPNLDRLRVLKQKYDPDNVFWKWHSFFPSS